MYIICADLVLSSFSIETTNWISAHTHKHTVSNQPSSFLHLTHEYYSCANLTRHVFPPAILPTSLLNSKMKSMYNIRNEIARKFSQNKKIKTLTQKTLVFPHNFCFYFFSLFENDGGRTVQNQYRIMIAVVIWLSLILQIKLALTVLPFALSEQPRFAWFVLFSFSTFLVVFFYFVWLLHLNFNTFEIRMTDRNGRCSTAIQLFVRWIDIKTHKNKTTQW